MTDLFQSALQGAQPITVAAAVRPKSAIQVGRSSGHSDR